MELRRVFDAHAHLAAADGAVTRLLSTMDACGIDRAIVVAGGVVSPERMSRLLALGGGVRDDADNEAVRRGCERSGGRLVPFFFGNPHRPSAYREQGEHFAGLKLAPTVHGVPLDDPRTRELVDVAAEFGHNVYAHCLPRPGSTVADLVRLARRYPSLTFALGHTGVGDMDLYGIDLVAPVPNVVVETSCGLTATVPWALRRLGRERVLFGSEYPMQSPRVELVKLQAAGLSEEDWRSVAWANVWRFVGEEA